MKLLLKQLQVGDMFEHPKEKTLCKVIKLNPDLDLLIYEEAAHSFSTGLLYTKNKLGRRKVEAFNIPNNREI